MCWGFIPQHFYFNSIQFHYCHLQFLQVKVIISVKYVCLGDSDGFTFRDSGRNPLNYLFFLSTSSLFSNSIFLHQNIWYLVRVTSQSKICCISLYIRQSASRLAFFMNTWARKCTICHFNGFLKWNTFFHGCIHSPLETFFCDLTWHEKKTQYSHWLIGFQKSDLLFIKHVMSYVDQVCFAFCVLRSAFCVIFGQASWQQEGPILDSCNYKTAI